MKGFVFYFGIFLFSFFLLQCKDKDTSILSKSQMKDLLYELYIQREIAKESHLDFARVRKKLFEKYKVSVVQFERTQNYYLRYPDLYLDVMQSVENKMIERLGDLNGR